MESILKKKSFQFAIEIVEYCEKLSLLELANFCKQAQFAICNDTAVAHVCALHQTPVLVIANGNRYGRFFPYPPNFKWVKVLYPK
jgi:ADP-heptose:LPS heptosyltransferase